MKTKHTLHTLVAASLLVMAQAASAQIAVSAVRCVMETIQLGTPLARAEMLDALTIRAINAYSGMTLQQAPTLFLEFCGSEASVAAQSELVAGIAAALLEPSLDLAGGARLATAFSMSRLESGDARRLDPAQVREWTGDVLIERLD